MEVYRISNTSSAGDLGGTGAKLYGGRWNKKGTGVLYTSESRALALLEYLVHVTLSTLPENLSLVTFRIPEELFSKHSTVSGLPDNWRDFPAPLVLANLGTEWVKKNKVLLLRVPSAIIEHEFNILINPQHPDFKYITHKIENFGVDDRLLKNIRK